MHWLLPSLGIAVAVAFGGWVAAEGTVAADQSARSALNGLAPRDRTVRLTWQGVVTPTVTQQARAMLHGLSRGPQSEVVLLNPVRLNGLLVRPAAVGPLDRWLSPNVARRLPSCRASECPMLLVGGPRPSHLLTAFGVRIRVVGANSLLSAVPLGFSPATDSAHISLLLTGDVGGLEALPGLTGVYRAHSWLAPFPSSALHSWQLAADEARLAQAQAELLASASQFSFSAPFAGLEDARAQAAAAPRRLLLAGGGALAAMVVFIVLAAGGLRKDQRAELERLLGAGARASHCLVFVAGESACICGVAMVAGAGLAIAGAVILASAAGEPVGGVLAHSVLTPAAAAAFAGAWVLATALIASSVLARGDRVADALAVAAVAALVVALSVEESGNEPLVLLLVPLCCLAAGVLAFRLAAALMRVGERLARGGPVLARLALVGMARAPALPSLAIAFVAVTVGLGGFALAYRATLLRGTTDQAADRVPLDATVSPGANFKTPLEVAPPSRWRAVANGTVFPVRRTDAGFASRGGTVTVPALGVPAGGLTLLHGWRASDGSDPLPTLARRLRPPGAIRVPGPELPTGGMWLALRTSSAALDVSVTADLRDPNGTLRRLSLGTANGNAETLRARLPRGRWELEAFELDEPTGLEITNGHQNGENPAAATQFEARVAIGPARVLASSGRPLGRIQLSGWRGVGAAASLGGLRATAGAAVVQFATSGTPGVLRPAEPRDTRAVPVLVDPATGAAAGPGGRLALTVDGLPVTARVVGILQRFPTIPADAAGFVVADEPTLSSALDAELPGQGRPDELWVSAAHAQPLRAALQNGPFAQLSSSFRGDVARELRTAPIARGVLRTLIAATIVSGVLAVLGMLVALLGAERDTRVEQDLEAQGVGPRGIRNELRTRLLLGSSLGVGVGIAITALLTLLAVSTVRAAGTVATPRPPLVTVIPWTELAAWGLGALAALAIASWLATWSVIRPPRADQRPSRHASETPSPLSEGVTP